MWPFRRKPVSTTKLLAQRSIGFSIPTILKRRMQRVPDRIGRYYVPQPVLTATEALMQRFGRENRECYVWWAGCFDAHGNAHIVTALWPDVGTEYGCVHLGTPELLALHGKLRLLDQLLLVELHTHPPGAGGQNDVDAAHPAATYRGFLSIVVPDFSFPRFNVAGSYVYEYLEENRWRQLTVQEVTERLIIEPHFVSVET
jgi:hypothetical protein